MGLCFIVVFCLVAGYKRYCIEYRSYVLFDCLFVFFYLIFF